MHLTCLSQQVSRIAFGSIALVLFASAPFGTAAGQGAPANTPQGDRVYLDLRGVDVRDALRFFSTKYGLQFVIASGVPTPTPVTFRDESPSAAAAREAILRKAGLATVAEGDVSMVLPAADAASLAAPGSAFKPAPGAKPVNLDLKVVSLDDVAKFLNTRFGAGIVLDEPLGKSVLVTCAVRTMPWDRALDAILRCNNLRAVPEGTGVRITTAAKSGA
jgi:hypothetical protein